VAVVAFDCLLWYTWYTHRSVQIRLPELYGSGAQLVMFPFLLLMLPVVAVLAWWLKRRYTAAIVRLQKAACFPEIAHEVSATAPVSKPSCAHEALPKLTLRILPAYEVAKGFNGVDCTTAPRRLRRRVLSVQLSSGLLYWCALLLFLTWVLAGQYVVAVLIFLGPSLLLVVLLPAGIAWLLQAGVHRTLMNVAAVLVLITGFGLLLSEGKEAWGDSALGFSFGYASIALVLSAFLRPAIRGAGVPLVIAGIVGWAVLTSMFAVALALDDSPDDEDISFVESAVAVMALLLMLAAAAWCGWRALMHLAIRYVSKRFSDMQLALGVYWALLTAFMLGTVLKNPFLFSLGVGIKAEWVCVSIVVFWLIWRWLQSVALRRAVRTAQQSIGALLFLRVFKPSRRSEEFTDRFFAYWRFSAPIWMIAGPDLAGAYIDPNEFFAYLRGRLREHFIADPGEAAARVQALDNARDPDGRFRINELLCTNNTWQHAVLQMIAHAGVILLDLREYSQQRKGARYELTELLRRAPLNKMLILIDAKDDVTRFTAEVESIWREVAGFQSDIAGFGDLQVLQFSKGSNAEMHGLFRVAVQAATT